MESIKKQLKQEKGSITMTVLSVMLLITVGIAISYFSISNKKTDQGNKGKQIQKQYEVSNSDVKQKYEEVIKKISELNIISINEAKEYGDIIISKNINTKVRDEEGHIFIIPAGFKMVNEVRNVTEGVIIQDNDNNEFVWIPVNIEKKTNSEEKIELNRYIFLNNGNVNIYDSSDDAEYLEENSSNRVHADYTNTTAKNINEFISKTNSAGGFWIGRYEARKKIVDGKTIITENNADDVYNNIRQSDAAEAARGMYEENENFETDLINGYAWDTATLFLQEYDDRINKTLLYASQNRTEKSFKIKGTDADKVCNVYDMAGNCFEWSTETNNNLPNSPCVVRGGVYFQDGAYTAFREGSANTTSETMGFRPIIYIK